MAERITGKVKWFSDQKGFDFMTPDDGSENLFVHQSSIQFEGFCSLAEGETIEFKIKILSYSRGGYKGAATVAVGEEGTKEEEEAAVAKAEAAIT
ncbi:uncharacterized protein LOC130138399 [Syzygium oleosum]|uniref:uncharacterized protein LOC130138399 n=1 Tax=Syzygium oleosum TaxID=219896 RepID=UPI0024B8A44B|nr:uncharacterized protein LOC130138399 [Syzygium oleosum]